MKKCIVLSSIVILLAAMTLAGSVKEYSMVQVTKPPGSDQELTQNYYVSGEKIRIEMSSPTAEMDMGMTLIADQEANKLYMMYPQEKIYWESPLKDAEMKAMVEQFKNARTVEKLGTEKILGEECTKEKVETVMNIMNQEIKTTSTIWTCDKYEFPLKIEGEDGAVTVVKEIKEGKQADELFIVPKDFQKVSGMMEAMQIKMKNKSE